MPDGDEGHDSHTELERLRASPRNRASAAAEIDTLAMSPWEYIRYNLRDLRDRLRLGSVFFLIALLIPSLNLRAQQTATVGTHLEGDSEFPAVHHGMATKASGSCASPSLTMAEASSLEAGWAEDVSKELQCLPGTPSTRTGRLNNRGSFQTASSVPWV